MTSCRVQLRKDDSDIDYNGSRLSVNLSSNYQTKDHRPSVLLLDLRNNAFCWCSYSILTLELQILDKQSLALYHLYEVNLTYITTTPRFATIPLGSSSAIFPYFSSLKTLQWQASSVVSQTSGKVDVDGMERSLPRGAPDTRSLHKSPWLT